MPQFTTVFYDTLTRSINNIKLQPLNLGGTSIGNGGPPGGFIGWLPQTRVSYDDLELDSLTTSGTPSLVDNLNHIRSRLSSVEKNAYGSFYMDDGNQVITISSAGVYYQVPSGMSSGTTHNMTFQNGRELKCTISGVYNVNWQMSVAIGSANQHIEGLVMVNSTAKEETTAATHVQNASDEQSLGGTGILTLNINDVVKLGIENETGTNNITVSHANLSLYLIS
jgi:hypothetical protein